MPTLAQHTLEGLEARPNATAWRAAPWTGQEAQGVLNETRPFLLKILYNTSCIVCKRACRRRRCPQSDRRPGGVAASYWMAERETTPVEKQEVVPGGVPATHCNGACSLLVINWAKGPIDSNL